MAPSSGLEPEHAPLPARGSGPRPPRSARSPGRVAAGPDPAALSAPAPPARPGPTRSGRTPAAPGPPQTRQTPRPCRPLRPSPRSRGGSQADKLGEIGVRQLGDPALARTDHGVGELAFL